jgi:hypothetical protein
MSFWMKSNSTDTPNADVVSWGWRSFRFYTGSVTDHLSFTSNGSWWDGAKSNSNLNDTNWHHVVGTNSGGGSCSGSNLTIYVDGSQQGTSTADASTNSWEDIGVGWGQDGYYPGTIDEIRLYNRVLSADETKRLYQMGK